MDTALKVLVTRKGSNPGARRITLALARFSLFTVIIIKIILI